MANGGDSDPGRATQNPSVFKILMSLGSIDVTIAFGGEMLKSGWLLKPSSGCSDLSRRDETAEIRARAFSRSCISDSEKESLKSESICVICHVTDTSSPPSLAMYFCFIAGLKHVAQGPLSPRVSSAAVRRCQKKNPPCFSSRKR